MKNSIEIPWDIKTRTTTWSSSLTFGYISKRISRRTLKRDVHTYANRGIIHKSQDTEATEMSTVGWINKENLAYAYNGVLLSLKQEVNHGLYDNADNIEYSTLNEKIQPWKEKTLASWFHLSRTSKIIKLKDTEGRTVVARDLGEEGRMSWSSVGAKFQLWKMNEA